MTVAFKYTMIFTYQSGINANFPTPTRLGGWSESYYSPTYDTATYNKFLVLCQKRLGICPFGTYISRIRVQQVDPPGVASLTKVSFNAPNTWLSDVPQMAIKVPFFIGNNSGQILREFRGVPDVQVSLGEYIPTGPYSAAVVDFLTQLTVDRWQARRRDKTQSQYQILSIAVDGTTIMTDPVVGMGQGTSIQVIRTVNPRTGRRFGYFAKIQTYTDGQHFILAGPKVQQSGFGKLRMQGTVYSTFTGPQFAGIEAVVRKVGRVFRSYSGRASKHQ